MAVGFGLGDFEARDGFDEVPVGKWGFDGGAIQLF